MLINFKKKKKVSTNLSCQGDESFVSLLSTLSNIESGIIFKKLTIILIIDLSKLVKEVKSERHESIKNKENLNPVKLSPFPKPVPPAQNFNVPKFRRKFHGKK